MIRNPIKVKTHADCAYKPCGKNFKKNNGLQRHCSQICYDKYQAEKKNGKPEAPTSNRLPAPKEKSLSDWKADLQVLVNKIAKLIDRNHPCIATNKFEKIMEAGHLFSVGSNETIRFHLLNIWAQSNKSNQANGGDPVQFKQGIVDLYGQSLLDEIEALKSISCIKLSIDDVKEKMAACRPIIKWLQLQDRIFTTRERLALRRQFNHEIDIY